MMTSFCYLAFVDVCHWLNDRDDDVMMTRYVGVAFAVATFTALVVMIWAKHNGEEILDRVVEAFIIGVTIVVVAIPEVSFFFFCSHLKPFRSPLSLQPSTFICPF